MKKCTSLLLIIGIIMFGVCGCMTKNSGNTAEKMRDLALNYLCTKYDDTFIAKGYSDSNWAYDYAAVTFSCEKYEDEIVEVRVHKNEDGTYRYEDNYFKLAMKSDAEGYLKKIVQNDDTRIKIRFPGSVWPGDIDGAKTFEEWLNKGTCIVDVFVLSDEEMAKENKEDILSSIVNDKMCGSISFFVVKTIESVENISLDTLLNNQTEYVISKEEFHIRADFTIEKEN